MSDCIFCKIVAEEAPSHKIWEDNEHLAFLSIFPNTPGFAVVITKAHLPSYIFDLTDKAYQALLFAAREVGRRIDSAFPDVGRTGLLLEGFGVDHAHAKLFPMHGTADMRSWQPLQVTMDTYFNQYPGYMSSHNGPRADDKELARVAELIRNVV